MPTAVPNLNGPIVTLNPLQNPSETFPEHIVSLDIRVLEFEKANSSSGEDVLLYHVIHRATVDQNEEELLRFVHESQAVLAMKRYEQQLRRKRKFQPPVRGSRELLSGSAQILSRAGAAPVESDDGSESGATRKRTTGTDGEVVVLVAEQTPANAGVNAGDDWPLL